MNAQVSFFDYPMMFKDYEEEYREIMHSTLARGAYILGEDVSRFEENLAEFLGSGYSVGVSNCTDAILMSLIAAGVGPGDEVISVSHTVVATIEAIRFVGAMPVLVDIADDHNMDVRLLESAISKKTKAIIPVHLNGTMCKDMDRLVEIAETHNLVIIEDSAQTLGGKYRDKAAGTFGLAGCFSFYPAKILGAFGDAGAVVTDDKEFAEKIRLLRNHGRNGTDVNMWGLNCRMDNLQAAVLNFKIKKLPEWITRRREIAKMYDEHLASLKELTLPSPPRDTADYYDVFQNYEIEADDRDALARHMKSRGIDIMLPWGGKGVHQFDALGLDHFTLPRTEEFFTKCLMLPLYPSLEDRQVLYVAETIKEFYHDQQNR